MEHKHEFACHGYDEHPSCSVWQEVICHMPYGIFSVALSLIVVGFLYFIVGNTPAMYKHAHVLFHVFHFLHIIFATTGSYIAFMRFTRKPYFAIFMSLFSSIVFCTLSDILMPYAGGVLLGFNVTLHLCIRTEIFNVLTFWAIGLVNGLVMIRNTSTNRESFTALTHFSHISTSAIASLLYLVAEGFTTWYDHMGILFVLLMGAVVLPCTLSDVIVPVLCGRLGKVNEKHTA
ncbi:MAG: hypothetical protein AB7F19_01455 [Candidatus Babeliales bacterium]